MTLPRWYALVGFSAAVGAASTALLAAYAWLAGSLWRFLDPLFQAFVIVLFLWLLVLPFLPGLTTRQRVIHGGVLLALFLLPAVLLGDGFLRLFVQSSILLKSFAHDPSFLITEGVFLLIVLTLTVKILRRAEGASHWRKNLRFVLSLFLVLFLVPVMANLQVVDTLQRTTFGLLLHARSEHNPKNPSCVVFQVWKDRITKERFTQLITLLAREEPAVIGLVPFTVPFIGIDTLSSIEGIPLITEYGSDRLMMETPAGAVTMDRMTGGFGTFGVPMYYEPHGRKGIDFTVKLVQRYLLSTNEPAEYSRSASSVTLGRRTIPLIGTGKVLINHYDRKMGKGTSPGRGAGFRTLVYHEYDQEATGIENSIWQSDSAPSYYVANYAKNRFEAPTGKEIVYRDRDVTWKGRELEPATINLRGKIVIIEFVEFNSRRLPLPGIQSNGHVVASITQNILDEDHLAEPQPGLTHGLVALLVLLTWWVYLRWGAFRAVGMTLLGNAVIIAVAIFGFTQWSFFLNPTPVWAALAGSLLVFFPSAVVSERQTLMKERTRLNAELQAARDMQMGLMPKEDPTVSGFDIAGICVPANEVGGDFFDYVWLDDKKTKLGIAVADVSGKAMRAAITAVMTSGMIYQEIENGKSPKKILRKINRPLYMKIDERMFTALSFAVLDTKKKELRFSNAGQMYPALTRKGRVAMLEVKGARLPLGVKEDVAYEEMVMKLNRGDTVIFYTDGIPEAKNKNDEFYGFDRFKTLAGEISGSAQEIRDRILDDVKSFTGKAPQYDDMTVVVVKVRE